MYVIPVLLAILVGLLCGLMAWGFLRVQSHEAGDVLLRTYDILLVGLGVLAVCALSVLLIYTVIVVG
jgi:hypothetical protein